MITTITRTLVMLALVLGGLVTASGMGSAVTAPAAAPAAPAAQAGMAIYLDDQDCASIGLPSTHVGQCLVDAPEVDEHYTVVAISAPDDEQPAHLGVEALLAAGYTGFAGDGMSAVYAPVDLVLFDEVGTWTVTINGLTRCEHGSERSCTGDEWVA